MCENSGKSSLDNSNLGRIGSVQRDSMWGISAVFTPTQDCECGVGATNVVDLKSCDAKMQVRASFQRALAFEKMGDVRSAENEIRHAEKIWKRLKLGRRVGSFATRVKLKNYLDSFDDFIERLKAWVMERGYLPWARGQTVEERRLAQWASLMRASRRKLPMDKQIKLEGRTNAEHAEDKAVVGLPRSRWPACRSIRRKNLERGTEMVEECLRRKEVFRERRPLPSNDNVDSECIKYSERNKSSGSRCKPGGHATKKEKQRSSCTARIMM